MSDLSQEASPEMPAFYFGDFRQFLPLKKEEFARETR
jgi:hypothetical protein